MNTWVVILIAAFAAPINGGLVPKIVGGGTARNGKYPYMVSINYLGSHSCGGSIINIRYVLTAAHCLELKVTSYMIVIAGTNNLLEPGDRYSTEKFIIHEKSGISTYYHDIGLIRITEDFRFHDKVQPIGLPSTYYIPDAEPVLAMGWGRLGNQEISPSRLQDIVLNVVPIRQCRNMGAHVYHVCTLTESGEGICNGDSGGPLVWNNVQVGLVSYGVPCGNAYPDVYTRTYSYKPWIESQMSAACHSAASLTATILPVILTLYLRFW